MLDFLHRCNIKKEVLIEMKKVNSSANLYNFDCNQNEVIKIVNYLETIGVNCIDDLLIHRIEIFFISFDLFKERYIKLEESHVIQQINEDYTKIDELY